MSTSTADSTTIVPSEHLAEAGVWIARLHGDSRGPALEAGFKAWLQASPLNAKAFEVATDVWQEAGGIRRLIPLAKAPQPWFARRPVAMLTAIVAACMIFAAVWLFLPDRGVGTAIGEQRTLNLEDGTHIFLNTATRVVVKYDSGVRRVELKEGEALFNVAKRPNWPFIVTVGDRHVEALGTSFIVRHDSREVAVTLVEGKVAVAPVSGGGGLTLAPGERVSFEPERVARRDRPRLDKALAWRRGQVILDDTPLATAVAEMNRYSSLRLTIERPEAGALLVNGLFQAGDSKSFAEAIALTYGLSVVSRNDEILLAGTPTHPGMDARPETP